MRANIIVSDVEHAVDALWKIQLGPAAQLFLESHHRARKHDAKSRALRVNHVDDVSWTPSRKNWQQKNFRG